MGSGKTTLGKKLARKISLEFIDLDNVIIKNTAKTINDIFNEKGEDFFRMEERRALEDMLKKDSFIMAVGGGTPCFFNNMDLMKKNGLTIYLNLSVERIFERLKGQTRQRPLLKNFNDEELLDYIRLNLPEREKWYLQSEVILDERDQTLEHIYSKIIAFYS